MPRIFNGPVELSEIAATPKHTSLYVGTMLRFVFRVSKIDADPMNNSFPTIRIEAARIGTWHEWQQHEVWLNNYLVGTLDMQKAEPTLFIFPIQPKLLRIDKSSDIWKVRQENVNELIIKLGSGGFGLNDSFDVNWIEIDKIIL